MAVAIKTPSPFQAAIIKFANEGKGDAFVDAVAGSGKTSTLEMVAKHLSARGVKALFLAFNRHIAAELKGRLTPLGHNVSTIHGIGYGCIRKYLGQTAIKVEESKYQGMIRGMVKEVMAARGNTDRDEEQLLYSATWDIFRFQRSSLVDPTDVPAIKEIVAHYGLDVGNAETFDTALTIIPRVTERGETMVKEMGIISYCDMLWIPHAFGLTPWQYGFVLVDEAQDLSPAQRELALKCRRRGGRMIFVGDERQAIYGFAGSDARSVQAIIDRTKATRMPLSVCYRCPTSVVELAKTLVPQIEAAPGAPVGILEDITRDKLIENVRPNDLILCRTTAPLVNVCFELIEMGVAAKIKGKDIGRGLVNLVTKVTKATLRDGGTVTIDNWTQVLSDFVARGVQALEGAKDGEIQAERLMDQSACLHAIFRFSTPRSMDAFQVAIEDMFSDAKAAVTLATIHRAKGLEHSRVFILAPELMPHPMAKQAWAKEQEYNLMYVAYTRAMEALYFVR